MEGLTDMKDRNRSCVGKLPKSADMLACCLHSFHNWVIVWRTLRLGQSIVDQSIIKVVVCLSYILQTMVKLIWLDYRSDPYSF